MSDKSEINSTKAHRCSFSNPKNIFQSRHLKMTNIIICDSENKEMMIQ